MSELAENVRREDRPVPATPRTPGGKKITREEYLLLTPQLIEAQRKRAQWKTKRDMSNLSRQSEEYKQIALKYKEANEYFKHLKNVKTLKYAEEGSPIPFPNLPEHEPYVAPTE
jgi:hypothetical protein